MYQERARVVNYPSQLSRKQVKGPRKQNRKEKSNRDGGGHGDQFWYRRAGISWALFLLRTVDYKRSEKKTGGNYRAECRGQKRSGKKKF